MKNYKFLNIITGWLVFLIATVVYFLTIEPTASFWDCGEFITTAYKLEVGHPPGAPFFMIMGRVATLFAFGDVPKVAIMINIMSALSSSFTILFLFWTITHIAKKITAKISGIETTFNPDAGQSIAILGSGIVGALAYTFSDTFWFSAVEGEVYAMSSFFTALVFWAILKWENEAEQKYANRWLIFIAYMMRLSIGVHLLNLLAIPAIVFIYFYKRNSIPRYSMETFMSGIALFIVVILLFVGLASQWNITVIVTLLGLAALLGYFLHYLYVANKRKLPNVLASLKAMVISILILGIIQYGIIPGIIKIASWFELIFTNGFGLPYNTGTAIYAVLMITLIIFGLNYANRNKKVLLHTAITAFTVILLGYSSFAMIVIRSAANLPMDQNSPDNVFALLSYLNREQYGDRPLLYGQYFTAQPEAMEDASPIYMQKNGRYEIVDHKTRYIYNSVDQGFFPRMYSIEDNPPHIQGYMKWANIPGDPADPPTKRPSFGKNMEFFFKYQINFMYWRYFSWNFIGRQNDIQCDGDIINGNWISGIPFIDQIRLGDQSSRPEYPEADKGRNQYYFLPLLLGIIGLIFTFVKKPNDFWVITLLLLFTGLAIVLYTNQPPYQPRERDYAYAGSFYAFAIFIGLGVLGIHNYLREKMPNVTAAILAGLVSLLVPGILAAENWDDHDRSNRYTSRDIAKNYLNSCAPNAIIFTNGDNDTFPLWYVQEVEGYRTDVRVINLSYLNTDWYIDQMKRKAYLSDPVPFALTHDEYITGEKEIVYLSEFINKTETDAIYTDLAEIFKRVRDGKFVDNSNGERTHFFPTKKFKVDVDSAFVVDNEVVAIKDADKIVSEITWTLDKNYIRKNELMVLDLVAHNNWKRPVYFAMTVGPSNFMQLQDYFQLEGLAYRLVPIKTSNNSGAYGRINTDIMYENMMNKFVWGGIENPNVYLDENNRRMLMNMRNNFARLAEGLLAENKKDSAIKVLDRCIELIPHSRVPYNYYNTIIAAMYYEAGENQKASEILTTLANYIDSEISFFVKLPDHAIEEISDDLQLNYMLLREILRLAYIYQQPEIQEHVTKLISNVDTVLKIQE